MTKKIMMLAALVVTFAVAGAVQSNAQTANRIQFAKGKNSATVKGNTGSNGTTYVVRARSGQKITLTLAPVAGVGIKVENDGANGEQVLLREERGGTYEVYLEESGDFTIFVGSHSHKPVPFTLTVKITKMADI